MRPMLLRPRDFNEEKPTGADIDPDTGYLWWWEEWSNAWRLCDPSWCDTYKWWLPYNAIPDPDEYHFNEDYKTLECRLREIVDPGTPFEPVSVLPSQLQDKLPDKLQDKLQDKSTRQTTRHDKPQDKP